MQEEIAVLSRAIDANPIGAVALGITIESFIRDRRELAYQKSMGLEDARIQEHVIYPFKTVCTLRPLEWLCSRRACIIARADELYVERAKTRKLGTLFEYFEERTKNNYFDNVSRGYCWAASRNLMSISLRTGCKCTDHDNCVAVQYQWCLLKAMREEALGPIDF